MRRVAVLGSGGWGTALAVHLGRAGHDVSLWARDQGLVAEMHTRRANPVYLPDVRLPDSVRPTADLQARHGIELPIASQVAELLAGRKGPRTALDQLMGRPQRDEGE